MKKLLQNLSSRINWFDTKIGTVFLSLLIFTEVYWIIRALPVFITTQHGSEHWIRYSGYYGSVLGAIFGFAGLTIITALGFRENRRLQTRNWNYDKKEAKYSLQTQTHKHLLFIAGELVLLSRPAIAIKSAVIPSLESKILADAIAAIEIQHEQRAETEGRKIHLLEQRTELSVEMQVQILHIAEDVDKILLDLTTMNNAIHSPNHNELFKTSNINGFRDRADSVLNSVDNAIQILVQELMEIAFLLQTPTVVPKYKNGLWEFTHIDLKVVNQWKSEA